MSLIKHAERELDLAGLRDEDSDYDGMIGEAVLDLVKVFANQGHSGGSAAFTTDVFNRLARYQPLTPITSNPDEWMDVSAASGGNPMWQSRRSPSLFSTDGGATWYDLNDQDDSSVDDSALEQIRIWHRDAERNMLANADHPEKTAFFEGQMVALANAISAIEAENGALERNPDAV